MHRCTNGEIKNTLATGNPYANASSSVPSILFSALITLAPASASTSA